jgi:MFS family permease
MFYFSTPFSVWLVTGSAGAILGLIMPNLVTSASLFRDAVLRERVLALYTVSLSLSLICGPLIESYLLTVISLKAVFLFFSIFGFLATVMSVFIKFPADRGKGEKTKVVSNHGFQVSLFSIMAYNIPFSILLAFAGIYEKDTFGISLSVVSLLFSIFFAASFCTRLFLFARPARFVGRYMVMSMILSITGIAVMIVSGNVILFSVSLVFLGIPHGLSYLLSVLTISRSFRPEHRNIANSYFYSIMMFVGILLPLVGGFMVDSISFRGTLLVIVFIIIALLALTVRALGRWHMEKNQTEKEQAS